LNGRDGPLLRDRLQRAGRITGHILEARTGAPLAAVLVKVQATGQHALTGAEGAFEIADAPVGPHTLVVSVVGYGLVRHDLLVMAGRVADITLRIAEGGSGYVENVTVGGSLFPRSEPGVASQQVLGTRDLLALRGVIADDPFRAVHVMPTVATGDDFQAHFAVRGQGPAHIGIALDGVDTSLLFHTVRGLDDTGSIALINSDILDSATPRRLFTAPRIAHGRASRFHDPRAVARSAGGARGAQCHGGHDRLGGAARGRLSRRVDGGRAPELHRLAGADARSGHRGDLRLHRHPRQAVDGGYYAAADKNHKRLPAYARLDLRAERSFTYRRSRLTVFVETLNTLNRRNVAQGDFGINFANLVVSDLLEDGFPFLPSAGILIEF
jgi:hypothetical protein